MPLKAHHPCRWLGCAALTAHRFCVVHERIMQRAYDRTRAPASRRGYGGLWRRLRMIVLRAEPLCRQCAAPASEVDHILPLARGGDNSKENLQALCKSCHSAKTAREDGAWAKS